jgi:hypothetical protein
LLRPSDPLELHNSIDEGKQGVVAADAYVVPRMESRAALAHQDAPGRNDLAPEPFHPKPLRITVATISRAPTTFFMCHTCPFVVS